MPVILSLGFLIFNLLFNTSSVGKTSTQGSISRLALLLTLISSLHLVSGTSTMENPPQKSPVSTSESSIPTAEKLLVVFSDLDGTLIHYPKEIPNRHDELLKLPPSSTGMRGIVSSKTLALVQEIRQKGVKFVLVSGMRTTTLLSRLPYLPRADAYCTEAGGRIFYPAEDDLSSKDNVFVVKPRKYKGATEKDLAPFGLIEDMEWRSKMEKDTGKFDLASNANNTPNLNERDGLLWDFSRHLIAMGYVLDTKGYSVCFRVNRKQQTTITDDGFQALLDGRVKPWAGLSTSVNLSCIDFYPATSGKKNW